MLLSPDLKNVNKVIVPSYNNFIFFDIKHGATPHAVSHIAPHVRKARFGFTAWFTEKDAKEVKDESS